MRLKAEIIDSMASLGDEAFGPVMLSVLVELDPAPSRQAVIKSLERTICQVPLLGCCLERGFWRDRWKSIQDLNPEDLVEELEVPDHPPAADFLDQSINMIRQRALEGAVLVKEPPVKLWIMRQGTRGLLVCRFHHALSDGNGCLQIIKLIGENLNLGEDAEPPCPIPMNRSFFQVLRAFGIRDVPGIIAELAVEMMRPWAMLLSKPLTKWVESDTPLKISLVRMTIDGDEYQTLKSRADEHNLTINDLLVMGMLKLSDEFNQKLEKPSRFLNAIFTANLRRFLPGSGIQVANLSGDCFLVSRPKKVKTLAKAAAEVRNKIGEMKKKYLGIGFIMGPQVMTIALPIALMHAYIKDYVGFMFIQAGLHSMAMTNLGAMDEYVAPFGEGLKHASFIGPVWEIPFPFISITGFRDSLTLYFPQAWRDEEKAGLCQILSDRMRYYLLEWNE